MRLRGFSLMTNILEDYMSDLEVVINVCTFQFIFLKLHSDDQINQALECMTSWPLLQRNKVDDSKVTTPVMLCAESENETVQTLAKKVCLYL
jgi:[histone H3]-lysine36 N-trimethyltransferase